MSMFNKNTTDIEIRKHITQKGWSEKRIVSFLRGWNVVKNN